MKILLTVNETEATHIGQGDCYGRAVIDLIEEVARHYGPESLDDCHLLERLSKLPYENKYEYFDFSCPEDKFSLTLVNE